MAGITLLGALTMHVLVIDDHDGMSQLIEALVVSAGHTTVRARNGREGVALFEQQTFDLVITDIVMPVQEGLETIQKLRALQPKLKIIAVSGSGDSIGMDFLPAALAFGAVAALPKPIEPRAFLEALRKCAPK